MYEEVDVFKRKYQPDIIDCTSFTLRSKTQCFWLGFWVHRRVKSKWDALFSLLYLRTLLMSLFTFRVLNDLVCFLVGVAGYVDQLLELSQSFHHIHFSTQILQLIWYAYAFCSLFDWWHVDRPLFVFFVSLAIASRIGNVKWAQCKYTMWCIWIQPCIVWQMKWKNKTCTSHGVSSYVAGV